MTRDTSASLPAVVEDPVSRQRWMAEAAAVGVIFRGAKVIRSGARFITMTCSDPERGKAFLCNETVDGELVYLVVETPSGNWGMDLRTIYLEALPPSAVPPDETDSIGSISGVVDLGDTLVAAAKDATDNFTVLVTCGRCGGEWLDGVRYQDVTVVRCPSCSATNRVDSSDIVVDLQSGFAQFRVSVPMRSSRGLLPPPGRLPPEAATLDTPGDEAAAGPSAPPPPPAPPARVGPTQRLRAWLRGS